MSEKPLSQELLTVEGVEKSIPFLRKLHEMRIS